ncbi:MAG TPA: hypothetical protein P5243_10635 [Bacteroidales bacterium]|nr:hypothetical protein [Bacteroidales bacterium]
MEEKVEYCVVLEEKTIRFIGKTNTLLEAKKIKEKRKLQPNQKLWIGKYVNGVLQESI